MWIDRNGNNHTTSQVCGLLLRQCGASVAASELLAAYRVGAIYRNGGIWFQRVA